MYFDNAASAPMFSLVQEAMLPYLSALGNPSATHYEGRFLRVALEESRREVASCVGVSSGEIFFTSCATEANNWAMSLALEGLGISCVLFSDLEHPSVRLAADSLRVKRYRLAHETDGRITTEGLREVIHKAKKREKGPILVSIMHANNEIGTLHDLLALDELCAQEEVFFHSDMVQTVGHFPVNLSSMSMCMASASAHKFHGARGIGFLYVRRKTPMYALLRGGGQERGWRAGTENVAGAVGMAKALGHMCENMEAYERKGRQLKRLAIDLLKRQCPQVQFLGLSDCFVRSIWTILSFSLPTSVEAQDLMMRLDIEGVAISVGSACASGVAMRSHVLDALHWPEEQRVMRFSFSPLNTEEELKKSLHILARITQNMPLSTP